MADYQISKGDCLWNIAKANYNCKSNAEVRDVVNLIAKENNMNVEDTIHAGDSLKLPYTDKSIFEQFKADAFDEWSGSEDNYNKYESGQKVEDFKMFDFNIDTYLSDLNNFSKDYIDKYDSNKDGSLDFDEFVSMSTNGQESSDEIAKQAELYNAGVDEVKATILSQYDFDKDGSLDFLEFLNARNFDFKKIDFGQLFQLANEFNTANTDNVQGKENQKLSAEELFVGFNPDYQGYDINELKLNNDKYEMYQNLYSDLDLAGDGKIDVGDWASMLYVSDLGINTITNPDNYSHLEDFVDGKIDYETYQMIPMFEKGSSANNTIQSLKTNFYNEYYA